jgi:hypothetical protein
MLSSRLNELVIPTIQKIEITIFIHSKGINEIRTPMKVAKIATNNCSKNLYLGENSGPFISSIKPMVNINEPPIRIAESFGNTRDRYDCQVDLSI